MCDDGDLALYVLLCTKRNCRTPLNLNLRLARYAGVAAIDSHKPTVITDSCAR